MSNPQTVIRAVLDTNDFLEFRRFTELPWTEILTANKVVLLVPWKVVSELDSNKANNRSSTKRERARTVLPLIEKYAQIAPGSEVRPGVTMEYISGAVDEVCRQHDLTSSHADHAIIATALLARDRGSDPIVLVTGDTGMRMAARSVGLSVIPMPEEYRLPHALDDEERERRQIERDLQRIQARRPLLSVGWGEQVESFIRINMAPAEAAPPSEVDARVSRRMSQISPPSQHLAFGPTTIENPNYEGDLRRLRDFEAEYRQYLLDLGEYYETSSRGTLLTAYVRNTGTMAASDIRIEFSFPSIVEVSTEIPSSPKEPIYKRRTSVLDMINQPYMPELFLPQAHYRQNASSWVDGNTVILSVDKLQHTMSESTEPLFVLFLDDREIRSFQLPYRAMADELLEPVEGELNVVVTLVSERAGE